MSKQPQGIQEGIYFDLSNEEYHADPAIGSTDIKRLLESPIEYWYNSNLNPKRQREQFNHLKYGSALHCYLMEEFKFDKEFMVLPEKDQMKIGSDFYNENKDAPDFLENFQLPKTKTATQFKYIGNKPKISSEEYRTIKDSITYLRSRNIPSQLFKEGYHEVSIFWRDERTGLMCKCRHDHLNIRYSADYKSIIDINKINRQISNYKYYISSYFYLEGLRKIKKVINSNNINCPDHVEINWWHKFLEIEHDKFIFVFQEKNAPYRIRCKILDKEVHEIAEAKTERALDIYKQNIDKYGVKQWPDEEDQEIKVLDLYDLPYINSINN